MRSLTGSPSAHHLQVPIYRASSVLTNLQQLPVADRIALTFPQLKSSTEMRMEGKCKEDGKDRKLGRAGDSPGVSAWREEAEELISTQDSRTWAPATKVTHRTRVRHPGHHLGHQRVSSGTRPPGTLIMKTAGIGEQVMRDSNMGHGEK